MERQALALVSPEKGAWLKRWTECQEAVDFVAARKAISVLGTSWRVDLTQGGDISIVLYGSERPLR